MSTGVLTGPRQVAAHLQTFLAFDFGTRRTGVARAQE
jgi:hypothetical protein